MTTTEIIMHTIGSGFTCVGLLFINEYFSKGVGYGLLASGLILLTFRLDGDS